PAHFVHLAYLNYFVTYGVIGAIPLFAMIALILFKGWRGSLRPGAPRLLRLSVIYVYGFLVLSLTTNLLAMYVVFWMLLGFTAQLASWRPAPEPATT